MELDYQLRTYFQALLSTLEADAAGDDSKHGRPPEVFIVEEKEPSDDDPCLNTGRVTRRWRLTVESCERVCLSVPLPSRAVTGRYYHEGRADFSLRRAQGLVRIGWLVGPRYGRGYDIPAAEQHDGSLDLGEPRCTWVA